MTKFIRTATKVVLPGGEVLKRKLNPKPGELAVPRVRLDPGINVDLIVTQVPILSLRKNADGFRTITLPTEGVSLALPKDPSKLMALVPQYSAHVITGGRISRIRLTDLGGGLASGSIEHRCLRLSDIQSWFDNSSMASSNTIYNATNYTKPKDKFGLMFEEELTEGSERVAIKAVKRPVFSEIPYMELEEDSEQIAKLGIPDVCGLLDNAQGLRQVLQPPLPSGWFKKPQKRHVWVSHSDFTEKGYVFRDQQNHTCTGFEEFVTCLSNNTITP